MSVSRRPQDTRSEFFKRTISAQLHGFGAVLALIGGVVLTARAYHQHVGAAHLIACLVFILGGIFVLMTSSVYHFLHDGYTLSRRLEHFFEKLDHTAIYIFIAGTYTPFLMNALVGPWRTILMILIWTLAGLGVTYTFTQPYLPKWMQNRFLYTGLFVAMGWTLLIRGTDIYSHLSAQSVWLLTLGALSYSIGALIYATRWPRLSEGTFGFHELWHVMVLLGFTFHFFLILNFYSPFHAP